jgi:lysozyme family protein
MQSVNEMIDGILRREGGFVNHPADHGGATKFGITLNTLSHYLGKPVSASDVEGLDEDTARQIYQRNYFYGPKIDQLPPLIQPFIFDCAVNHGARRAIKFVQTVCNKEGYLPPLAEDGIMGAKTKTTAEKATEEMGDAFLKALLDERRRFYQAIVDQDPSQQVFLAGWMNRVNEFDTEIA